MLSTDGARAVVTTYGAESATGTSTTWVAVIDTTRVAVILTTTGTQAGTTLTLTGCAVWPVVSADGSRALIITVASGTTRVALLRIV